MKEPRKRIVYIDIIKVFLTCTVVAHHAGQAYGNTGGVWLESDNPKLDYLQSFFFFNAAYMMGFYFFISGYFTFHSLNNKPAGKFLKERLIRLGVPLVFFAFFVFGPLHYFRERPDMSFLSFLKDLHFNRPPLSVGHLWFVASLLAYSLFYLLIVKVIKTGLELPKNFSPAYPLLYLLFLIPVNVLVRQHYPIDHWETWLIPIEVGHLPQYLSLFLLGTLFGKTRWLDSITPSTSIPYFAFGLILFFLKAPLATIFPGLLSESIVESFLCVGLCLGILYFAKIVFKEMTKPVQFLSDNSYGIYLFHLLIVVWLQTFLKNFSIDSNLKFVLVTLGGIYLSALLTQLLKKISLLRKVL